MKRSLATAAALALLAGEARAQAPASLQETGLYGAAGEVRPDHLPFAPQYPLWSDGASKRRWIHLPPGAAVDATGPEWRFPVGTRLWKEFSVSGRKMETRFLERRAEGWTFAAYVWNAAGTEATLAPAAGAEVVGPNGTYRVPGETDCRSCHEGRSTPVLGFSLLQQAPQLQALAARGVVQGLSPETLARPPRIAAPTAAARAALGYLAGNCGHCHNQAGPLAGLEMTLDAADGVAALLESTVGRPSRFLPPGASGEPLRIAAGRPDLSVLVARMRSRDPLVRMPPVGTTVVDEAGLALIERWIRETNRKEERP